MSWPILGAFRIFQLSILVTVSDFYNEAVMKIQAGCVTLFFLCFETRRIPQGKIPQNGGKLCVSQLWPVLEFCQLNAIKI